MTGQRRHERTRRNVRAVEMRMFACDPASMAPAVRESRRYDFPPLWAVPVLVMGAITVAVCLGLTFGLLGFILALVFVWWLERKADAYVRARDSPTD